MLDKVILNDRPLMLVNGSYTETEAQRFGDKLSIGDIRYADFNPFETAEATGNWNAGYGLQRYSDHQDPAEAHRWLRNVTNLDASNGYVIMSGEPTATSLFSGAFSAPPIFMGEAKYFGLAARATLIIAGAKVYLRSTGGWVDYGVILPSTPLQQAVAFFGGKLIIGYGADRTAQSFDGVALADIKSDAGGTPNLYVYAATSDKGSAYIVGGSSSTNTAQIMASTDGVTFSDVGKVQVYPSTGDALTGLAPGGGVATVFWSGPMGLGRIDTAGVVRTDIPFEWYDPSNGLGLGWVMGQGDDPQRGPLMLRFRRDNDPYVYQPGPTGQSGKAQNLAPWADPAIRPLSGVGVPTAWFGTARWLYVALQNPLTGSTTIVRRDARTGAILHYWELGGVTCNLIGMTRLDQGNLRLIVGTSTGTLETPMVRTGGSPLTDTTCRYISTGIMDLPGANMGFPDEEKVEFAVRVEADNLQTGNRYITVSYATENSGSYTLLGTADQSPVTEIFFDAPQPSDRQLDLRLTFTNAVNTQTIVLNGVSMRRSINPTVYKWWEFDAWLPAGQGNYADDLQDTYQLRALLWQARRDGTPVSFTDIHGDIYSTRIMNLSFKNAALEINRPPQDVIHVTLLQGPSPVVTASHEVAIAAAATAWPLPTLLPTCHLGISTFAGSFTATNVQASTVYGTVYAYGPLTRVELTNSSTAQSIVWNGTIGVGDYLRFNFDPTKKIVIDSTGANRFAGLSSPAWWGYIVGANTITYAVYGCGENTRLFFNANVAF